MRKIFLFLILMFLGMVGYSQPNETITINKIIYNISGNPFWDNNELLEKNQFTIIFKEGGEVELTRNDNYRSKQ
jgi:hypothetical protein